MKSLTLPLVSISVVYTIKIKHLLLSTKTGHQRSHRSMGQHEVQCHEIPERYARERLHPGFSR